HDADRLRWVQILRFCVCIGNRQRNDNAGEGMKTISQCQRALIGEAGCLRKQQTFTATNSVAHRFFHLSESYTSMEAVNRLNVGKTSKRFPLRFLRPLFCLVL